MQGIDNGEKWRQKDGGEKLDEGGRKKEEGCVGRNGESVY